MVSLSFLPPSPDQIEGVNPLLYEAPYSAYETFGTAEAQYFRSASEKLVSVMRNWKCKRCNKEFAKVKDQPPYMAYCGHFIHIRCHYTRDVGAEVETYFKCDECVLKRDAAMRELPLLDSVIEDFFQRILEKGIRCTVPGSKKLHARYNTFLCMDIGMRAYFCVWCATSNPEVVRRLENVDKRLIPEGQGVERSDAIQNVLLTTLDRTHSMHLNQCCICRETLCDTKSDQVDITHLPCKHVCHVVCSDAETEERIKCNFCGTVSMRDEVKKRVWHSKDYLKFNQDDTFYKCDGDCKQSHPPSNLLESNRRSFGRTQTVRVCVWCTVQKKEHERREEKKKEDGKEMERCNRKSHNEGAKAKK